MQDKHDDQIPVKPNIHMMERSPLLQKAEFLVKMLQEDDNRINQLKSENKLDEISMEQIDENDEAVIQMNIIPGVYEIKNLCQEVIPLDTTEMPEDTWRKATEEPKKE